MDKTYIGYFDGASELGVKAGYGYILYDNRMVEVSRGYGKVDNPTNNTAEYTALINLLKATINIGARRIEVRGDSQLVIKQMLGEWRPKTPHIAKLWLQAKTIEGMLWEVTYVWVPRELNREADRLSKMGMLRG